MNTINHTTWLIFAAFFSLLLALSLYKLSDFQDPLVANAAAAGVVQTLDESGTSVAYNNKSQKIDKQTTVNSDKVLNDLGYSFRELLSYGVFVSPHNGQIEKHCEGASGIKNVSGLAVKSGVRYPTCPDGKQIIPETYQNVGLCTVHFDASKAGLHKTATGNSTAIFAHELGHCLYFIYGENKGMREDYIRLRPELERRNLSVTREIFADDYMLCVHKADTNWGAGSYYEKLDVDAPNASYCRSFKKLAKDYFPL